MTINAPMRPSTDKDNATQELLTKLHQNGVTYQAIANHLGVNWRTVHRWRNGQTHPSTEGLVNVALRGMLVVFSGSDDTVKTS